MKSIGIDIGSYSVKVAEVFAKGRSVIIRSLSELPLNSEINADNKIALLEILRNIASQNDPHTTIYTLAISQDQVTTRLRLFPFSERKKILKSLPIELEDEIPIDQSNAIFDAKFIRHRGTMTEVVACATPKERVKEILQIAHDAGIEPQIISMEAIAHANTVERWDAGIPKEPASDDFVSEESVKPAPEEASILVDIGHRKTIVSLFRKGRWTAVRTIIWGGRNLVDAVSKKYGVLYHEALRETQAKSFILIHSEGATRDQIVFSDTLSESLDEMLKELKLTLLEWATSYNLHFTGIQIIGGACRVRNLNAYLTQVLELPCNYFDPFGNFQSIDFEKTQTIMTGSGVAVGLALEGLKRVKNFPVNFRKQEFALQSASWELFWEKWAHTVRLGAVAMVAILIYGFVLNMVSTTLAEKSEESLKSIAAKILNKKSVRTSEIEKYIRDQNREFENQKKLASLMGMNSSLDILNKLSQALPSKAMDIIHLNIDKQSLSIEGTVKDAKLKQLIEDGLKSISIKKKVVSKKPAKASGPLAFAYEIEIDRNIEGIKP